MKINQIAYYDHELEWRFEPIQFSNLTLLVGISGVGKTQILQSIMNLRKIAKGGSLNGIEWSIKFSINDIQYYWEGKFEDKQVSSLIIEDDIESNKYRILHEKLLINNEVIIERNHKGILFKGKKLPKLSPFQSVVDILGEEEDIALVKNGFNKIIYSAHSTEEISDEIFPLIYASLAKKDFTLEDIQESNLPIQIKLALA
ncbi:MAG: ATP-binding protein, partial [Rhizonema sp. PD37]|nr:ATP-binding protein [Rhizonema sp. PD37]